MDCEDWLDLLGFDSLLVAVATSKFDNFRRLLESKDLVQETSQASKLLNFAAYRGENKCLLLMLEKRMFKSPPILLEAMKWAIKGKSDTSLENIMWHMDVTGGEAKIQVEKVIVDLTGNNRSDMLKVIYDSRDFKETFGYFALKEACRMGNANCIQWILKKKVKSETDLILLALKSGKFDCVDLLLKHTFPQNETSECNETAWLIVNDLKIEDMQEEELECGRQLLCFKPKTEGLHLGESLLQMAFQKSDIAAIEKILHFWSKTLNIDMEDHLGKTPLMHAVGLGLNAMVKQMLWFGANPLKVDCKGLSALEISNCQENLECYTTMKRHLEVEALKCALEKVRTSDAN